jgi:hypothetical protein
MRDENTPWPRGTAVTYEMRKKDGTSFAIPARVLEDRGRRVLIRYRHWTDGRLIDSLVRAHRVKERRA